MIDGLIAKFDDKLDAARDFERQEAHHRYSKVDRHPNESMFDMATE